MFKRMAMTCAAVAALAACQPQAKTDAPAALAAPALAADQPAPQAPTGDVDKSVPSPTKAAAKGEITVKSPAANAKLSSPLTIEGMATSNFFFEAVFPVELIVDGKVIARGPAQAVDDWTVQGPVKFKATLDFTVTKETKADLVLMEDMPEPINDTSDERGPARSIKIPVVLVP